MKGAPDFKQWPDSVCGIWKYELLRWLGKTLNIRVLIETGTCEGVTPFNLYKDFNEIHTVELHRGLYDISRKRLEEIPNVYQFFGDSRSFLKDMVQLLLPNEKVLFWLDAHPCGPHSADAGDPLPEELQIITDNCLDALIVVDDMQSLAGFMQQIKPMILPGWHKEFRTGATIIYKEGRYNIPEFEE